MQRLYLLMLAAFALLLLSSAARAMSSMDDADLADVHGRDGVTLAADLDIRIGSFSYSNKSAGNPDGGSISFNNITLRGMFVMTVDLLNSASFTATMSNAMAAYGADGTAGISRLLSSGTYDGHSDVIQFALPNAGLDHRLSPSLAIASVTMGNSSASFGSFAFTNIDLQGSKIWMWAR
ncbi:MULTISPECIES: DUF6160 family protein [Roseateles]|uniref:DUF6160 domain-containing protein n=1 Tax=Roseateles albus TaxID=2987525 RepID=A0ABT5KEZ8_9BURK|nr:MULTISPECIES: DUF6160 family protein [Roseateles]MCV2358095.1 hypothetical protein [Paucibacter sp. TC2R-5]MDC8772390.1 hypothetical protein [Roseateles albus]